MSIGKRNRLNVPSPIGRGLGVRATHFVSCLASISSLFIEKDFVMNKFCIGFFVAACVCGLMLCFDGVAEAGVIGAVPAAIAPVVNRLPILYYGS